MPRPLWAACAQLVQAVLAGRRVMLMGGLPALLALVQFARGTAALGAGRYDEAYQHLDRIFAPQDAAYHPHVRAWALVDLAEAAAGGNGNRDAARRRCAELTGEAATTGSPLLRASMALAAPILATEDAQALFDAAFDADLATWPLHRARLQLAYGRWLRRRQQAADSRAPGAPRCGRAQRSAIAEGAGRAGPAGAADRPAGGGGLSNREIGQQLYLSHRTVRNHLYRIFPKLGVTSRAELAAVVGGAPGPGA